VGRKVQEDLEEGDCPGWIYAWEMYSSQNSYQIDAHAAWHVHRADSVHYHYTVTPAQHESVSQAGGSINQRQ